RGNQRLVLAARGATHRERPHGVWKRGRLGGPCVPRSGDSGGLQQQWRPRRAAPVPLRLLRRVRARSRRQQHRGGQPPPVVTACSAGTSSLVTSPAELVSSSTTGQSRW